MRIIAPHDNYSRLFCDDTFITLLKSLCLLSRAPLYKIYLSSIKNEIFVEVKVSYRLYQNIFVDESRLIIHGRNYSQIHYSILMNGRSHVMITS